MGRGAGCGAGAAGFMGAGAAGFGAGAAGFAATTGFGAATTGFAAGFLAATGFRAGALRAGAFLAAALRAAGLRAAVLRAGAFFLALVFLRALAFLATARPVLRTVRAALRAVLRTVRAVFRAPLRALALLAVRFFPLVFVAMASAPILPYCRTRPLKRTRTCANQRFHLVQACRPIWRVNRFFLLYADRNADRDRKWQAGAFVWLARPGNRPEKNASIPMRWRKSGSTKRALTRPSRPMTRVAGMGRNHPPFPQCGEPPPGSIHLREG